MRKRTMWMVPTFALLLGACVEPLEPDDAPTRDAGTTPWTDGGDGTPDTGTPDAGETPDAGPGIGASAVKPNVMLLIDRSGSMAEPSDCGEATCPSKWEQLLALGSYLAEAKRLARLGLAVFPAPDEEGCGVAGGLLVPLSDAADVDEQILAETRRIFPGGRTPVAAALDSMGRIGDLDDPDRKNVLLVLTDGRPNCACSRDPVCERDEAVAAVERLTSSTVPVDIDIVGFGQSARDADETLTAMALAAGDDRYYQADTIEELIGTLYEVSVRNVPCTFHLDEWPDPADLIVWKDGEEVPACTGEPCTDGYTYDPSTGEVELHGASCEALRDGERHNVWFETRS